MGAIQISNTNPTYAEHSMEPLLSIIIPTKNRHYTAVFAVQSVLNIKSDQIEVIVQDCSDDNTLQSILTKAFGTDKRVKYFHSGSNLISLTQNWNLAIANTSGRYIVGIGDDDAVLPYCIEMANWMSENDFDAVLGPIITYIWKDAYIRSFSNSRLTHSTNYSGNIFRVELQQEFIKKSLLCGFGYTEGLPNIYHGIVKRSLFEDNKLACGHYLDGTSFDVYNSIMLPAYAKSFYYVDYPLTIRGVSGKSNANRIVSKKFQAHFNEFKNLHIPDILPRTLNAEVSIGESTIVALQDTRRSDLISQLCFAIVFGKCAAIDLFNAYRFYKHYRSIRNQYNSTADFFKYFITFLVERIKAPIYNIILKLLFKMAPNPDKLIGKLTSRVKVVMPDILSAIESLDSHLKHGEMYIKYEKLKVYNTKKELWD